MLKNIMSVVSVAVAGILIIGCSEISSEALEAHGMKGVPSWVTGNNGAYTAVATAPIVDGDIDFARNEAADLARAKLAKEVQSKIEYVASNDKSREGKSGKQEVKQKAKAIASQVLNGTHEVKWWMNTENVAVLVELPKHFVQDARRAMKDAGIDYDKVEKALSGKDIESSQDQRDN